MTEDAANMPGMEEAFAAEYPLGRVGTSDDIAAAAVFLASDECFMTGQNLQVNGGLTLRRNPTQSEINTSLAAAQEKRLAHYSLRRMSLPSQFSDFRLMN